VDGVGGDTGVGGGDEEEVVAAEDGIGAFLCSVVVAAAHLPSPCAFVAVPWHDNAPCSHSCILRDDSFLHDDEHYIDDAHNCGGGDEDVVTLAFVHDERDEAFAAWAS